MIFVMVNSEKLIVSDMGLHIQNYQTVVICGIRSLFKILLFFSNFESVFWYLYFLWNGNESVLLYYVKGMFWERKERCLQWHLAFESNCRYGYRKHNSRVSYIKSKGFIKGNMIISHRVLKCHMNRSI